MKSRIEELSMRIVASIGGAALVALLSLSAPAEAQRAAAGPPDWPCVQRLIPELAWGSMWSGPSIEELEENWWADEEIGRVVRFAGTRETAQSDAVERVREFAAQAQDDVERRLTLLFAGLYQQITRERTQTIAAIRRFANGQVGRLERIGMLVDQLEEARSAADPDPQNVEQLENEIFWERRVFEDRQASLRSLCDQPYLLEERLSRLVRVIQAEM
jgi:hypothetical protein